MARKPPTPPAPAPAPAPIRDGRLSAPPGTLGDILDSLNDVVWSLDPESLDLIYLNPAAERLYGRRVAEFAADRGLWLRSVHPEDRERVVGSLATLLDSGECELTYRVARPDGEVRWVHDRGRAIRDAAGRLMRLDGIVTDITEERRARDALAAGEARLRAMTASVPGMVFQLAVPQDGALRFLFVGAGSRRLVGVGPEEILGDAGAFLARVHDEDRPALIEALRVPDGPVRSVNWMGRVRRPGDGSIWVNLRASASVDASGMTWSGVAVNVTRDQGLTRELMASRARLQELSAYLHSVREAERGRIAREIHDELGATLTAVKMELSWTARNSRAPRVRDSIREAIGLVDGAIQTVRKISTDLRPSILDHLGLWPAMEWQCREFQERARIPCEFEFHGEEEDVEAERATAAFRIFQEALTNVARHAHASRVCVRAHASRGEALVEVADDGRGISAAQASDPRAFGLQGMRERAASFGGVVTVAGTPGLGTVVYLRLPLKDGTP